MHPGYGFLSENAGFAARVREAGLVWVGPAPETITLMGDKGRAKLLAERSGVPVVPGTAGEEADADAIAALAAEHGFPIVIKALAGGGGKGMRVVREQAELEDALAAARREAEAAFGDGRVLAERYLERPRHIEVQVLGDSHGTVVHLGERECSLQRRHQKVIEEAPSPAVDAELRERLGKAAADLARACDYVGAGTVEFIVPADTSGFYFLEMNTRLQVEHPVTEMVWGVDLVEQQLRVAAGEPLPFAQEGLSADGHAVEARLYSEDPAAGFLPAVGTVRRLTVPAGPGVRVDLGIAPGAVIGTDYDPMLAKLIAHGPDRATAIARLDRALADLELLGVAHNAAFSRELLARPDVLDGRLDTGLLERALAEEALDLEPPEDLTVAAAFAIWLDDTAGSALAPGPWRRRFEDVGRGSDRAWLDRAGRPAPRGAGAGAGRRPDRRRARRRRARLRGRARGRCDLGRPRGPRPEAGPPRRPDRRAHRRGLARGADAGQGALDRGRQRRRGRRRRRPDDPRVDEDGAADHGAGGGRGRGPRAGPRRPGRPRADPDRGGARPGSGDGTEEQR